MILLFLALRKGFHMIWFPFLKLNSATHWISFCPCWMWMFFKIKKKTTEILALTLFLTLFCEEKLRHSLGNPCFSLMRIKPFLFCVVLFLRPLCRLRYLTIYIWYYDFGKHYFKNKILSTRFHFCFRIQINLSTNL